MGAIVWLLALSAQASSLDLLEVGGAWGTPGATGPTALWYNPAAMSFERGTRFLVEGAPIVADIRIDRDDPGYAWSAPGACDDDPTAPECARPIAGGPDRYQYRGVIPFLGLVSDATVPGLGVGFALYVPQARAGNTAYEAESWEDDPLQAGSGRTHLRGANVLPVHVSAGASWAWRERIGFGAAFTYIYNTWYARIDNESLSAVEAGGLGPLLGLSPADAERPEYLALTEFGPLHDHTVSFQAGLYGKPHEDIAISVGFAYGARVDNTGDVTFRFACPRESYSADTLCPEGLPDPVTGSATVGYRYPMRLNFGLVMTPDVARIELMGGWIRWSQYTDFEIETSGVDLDLGDGLGAIQESLFEGGLNVKRKWARDNRDSWWLGLDTKFNVSEQVQLGGRAIFDRAAVPDVAMSPNNADFDTLILGANLAWQPAKTVPLRVGLSYTNYLATPRTVTTNGFSLDLDPEVPAEDRYRFPAMNGRYEMSQHRVGISLQGAFETPKVRGPKKRKGG